MSLRGHHNSTSIFVGMASFLVVRLGLSYWALPATGVRGILTQEAIDTEQAVTEAHSTGRSDTVLVARHIDDPMAICIDADMPAIARRMQHRFARAPKGILSR